MNVTRVLTERGSHVEPSLDEDWPAWKRLEWLASVVAADTGLPVRISEARFSTKRFGKWRVDPDMFSVNYGHGSICAYPYAEAWALLTGLGLGASLRDQEARS